MPSTPLHTSAYAAHVLLLLAFSALTVHAAPSMTYVGCFSSSQPLTDQGSYTYQTTGYCQQTCLTAGQAVLGLSDGSNCWCGDQLPATSSQVDDSECDTPCNGFGQTNCGGSGVYGVYLTGTNNNPGSYGGGGDSSSSSPSSSPSSPAPTTSTPVPTTTAPPATTTVAKPSIVTHIRPGKTVVITQSPSPVFSSSPTPTSSPNSGTNTVGIAVGVVVGVVLAAAILAGSFFYIRARRRRMAEDEYERSRDKAPPGTGYSATSDSRLDPEAGNRRNSVGSIADAGDYSRKILRVANPDHG